MRYVILRDDDTNALTPPEYLERLYRPFLDRQLPVNLAVIPNVRTEIRYGDNILEGFLMTRGSPADRLVPIRKNQPLVEYLIEHPEYHIVQHGYNHEFVRGDCEFEQNDRDDLARRLEDGARLLTEAGFSKPSTFVAPYDRFTRTSLREVARRFPVISAAWFELSRVPYAWWPRYFLHKLSKRSHWELGNTTLLTHPRCYLSHRRSYAGMLEEIKHAIARQRLTVLVTHWWEFFHEGTPDAAFIDVLHKLAEYLGSQPDLRVVRFGDVAERRVPLN